MNKNLPNTHIHTLTTDTGFYIHKQTQKPTTQNPFLLLYLFLLPPFQSLSTFNSKSEEGILCPWVALKHTNKILRSRFAHQGKTILPIHLQKKYKKKER